MSQNKLDRLKEAVKKNFTVNKEGEVELNEELQKAIAGGVTPEQPEDEPNLNCEINLICHQP